MQPLSSSSTVQPLSKSRVLAMAAGAGGLGPSYGPKASHGVRTLPLSWEKQSGSQRRHRRSAGRIGTGRSGHAPCWAGAELPAAATPGVKRSCPGMVQPASWEMD